MSEWEKTLTAGAFAKNAELGSFGRFWTVWAVLENVALTTASTLPEDCLYSIARQILDLSTELRRPNPK